MKRINKKGFTIVELVIVIAVIAILAGVLIPTFTSLIRKAQTSKDTQLVRNLNTALVVDKASGNSHNTMTDALEAAKEAGYDVSKINASNTDNEILWDSANDVFCYYVKEESSVKYIPETTLEEEANDVDYWKISNTVDTKYSTYLYGYTGTNVEATKGLDVGETEGISTITYNTTGTKQDVVIRTNGQMTTLIINGLGGENGDTVSHYGFANVVNVNSVGNNDCYHEFGTTNQLVAKAGKVVISSIGNVFELKKHENAEEGSNAPTFKNNGGNVLKADAGTLTESEISTNEYNINSYEQLCAFRDATNSGKTFEGITVNLNCNIILTKGWKPISNYSRNLSEVASVAFAGTFNGKNHTVSGLTNEGLSVSDVNTGKNNSTPEGNAEVTYGFFASVNNATIKNITFDKVVISNKGFGDLLGDSVGACVGFSCGNTNINNITVNGIVEGHDSVGGILGRDKGASITIEDCVNNANVFSYCGAAGIAGRIYANNCVLNINNCTNNGTIVSDYTTAYVEITNHDACYSVGITDIRNNVSGTITNCINTGTIKRVNPTNNYKTGHIGQITIDVQNKLTKTNNQENGTVESIDQN